MFALVIAGDEQTAQQLSDRGFRQAIHEDDAPWPLEVRKTGCPAELLEVLLGDRPLALHKGRDNLAPLLVGNTDHGDFEYGLVQRKAAFDLDRRDVLAPGNDHVVYPAGDEQIAVTVDETGVAGEIPAFAQGLGVRVGPAPVPLE